MPAEIKGKKSRKNASRRKKTVPYKTVGRKVNEWMFFEQQQLKFNPKFSFCAPAKFVSQIFFAEMLLHRSMLTKMTKLFTFFLKFVRKWHNLYNLFTWGEDPAPFFPDPLRCLYSHRDQTRPVLLLKELNICSSPSKIKKTFTLIFITLILLWDCVSDNFEQQWIEWLKGRCGIEPFKTVRKKPMRYRIVLFYSLKVLSNGAGGGPKLVSIDPFW